MVFTNEQVDTIALCYCKQIVQPILLVYNIIFP